eukprot:UN11457
MGGTSQPGPIVYAKHYAETFAQMILKADENLHDLDVSENLTSRPTIIRELINLPDITNGDLEAAVKGKVKGKQVQNDDDNN